MGILSAAGLDPPASTCYSYIMQFSRIVLVAWMESESFERRLPKLGSEVRFGDGATAGKVKALNGTGFVVVSGRKRVKQVVMPYSSIASIGNRLVVLRENRHEVRRSGENIDKETMSKKVFLKDLDDRLELDNLDRTERIARTTLNLMTSRLPRDRKKQIKKILPSGVRSFWTTTSVDNDQSFEIRDFLLPIKKEGRFQSMEEAFIAAREVFALIKKVIPASEMTEITHSIPRGMQEIWESAS